MITLEDLYNLGLGDKAYVYFLLFGNKTAVSTDTEINLQQIRSALYNHHILTPQEAYEMWNAFKNRLQLKKVTEDTWRLMQGFLRYGPESIDIFYAQSCFNCLKVFRSKNIIKYSPPCSADIHPHVCGNPNSLLADICLRCGINLYNLYPVREQIPKICIGQSCCVLGTTKRVIYCKDAPHLQKIIEMGELIKPPKYE